MDYQTGLSQWAHNVKMTLYQRRCDVITSHRRWYDIILMRACWDARSEPSLGAFRFREGCNYSSWGQRRPWSDMWMYRLIWVFIWRTIRRFVFSCSGSTKHDENTPIQIYWKCYHPKKMKVFRQKFWYFSYFCSKHRLWVPVRTASARRF